MSDEDDSTERISILRDRVDEDPDAVSVGEVVRLVEPADVAERRQLVAILDRKVAAAPTSVTDVLEAIEPFFDHENDDVRTVAATTVELLAGRYPERVTGTVDHLSALIHDDNPFARRHAVWALAHLSGHDPELVAPFVPELRPADDEPPYFEREHVVTILRNVVAEQPDEVVPLVPALLEVLESADRTSDGRTEGVHTPGSGGLVDQDQFKDPIDVPLVAAELVADVADTAPADLEPYVGDLIAIVEDAGRRTVRRNVVNALASLARENPAAVEPAVPGLAARLQARDVELRVHAARALALVAAVDPAAVTDAVESTVADLEPLLREGTPPVQGAVAGLLSYVAEADPATVDPVVDPLIACLDAEEVFVRGSAAIALGHAGGEDAKAALADLLDADLDPELRETVRDAIRRIEARGGTRP